MQYNESSYKGKCLSGIRPLCMSQLTKRERHTNTQIQGKMKSAKVVIDLLSSVQDETVTSYAIEFSEKRHMR